MSKKINFGKAQPVPFSRKKQVIAIIAHLLCILFVLSLLFFPVIQSSSKITVDGKEFTKTVAFSPFRLAIAPFSTIDLGFTTIDLKLAEANVIVTGGTLQENLAVKESLGSKTITEPSLDKKIRYFDLFAIIVSCIAIPVNLHDLFSKIPPNKRKNATESMVSYTERYLKKHNQHYFTSLYHLTIPNMLAWLSFFPLMLSMLVSIAFFLSAKSADFSVVIPIILGIAGIIAQASATHGYNIILNTEWEAIVVHKYIYDPAQGVLRARTPEEMEQLLSEVSAVQAKYLKIKPKK